MPPIEFAEGHVPYVLTYKEIYETLKSYLYSADWWRLLYTIDDIADYLTSCCVLDCDYKEIADSVYVHKTAKIAPTACLEGPAVIDAYAEIRHCAYIRGNAIIGQRCVVGNSCEIKNSILFNDVQVPHFNYIGDSILGYKAHFGAGAITSNLKADKGYVSINGVKTYRKKIGALVGDFAEIGCNTVLNPGTIIGRNTVVYPNSMVRGVIPSDSIYKSKDNIVQKRGY